MGHHHRRSPFWFVCLLSVAFACSRAEDDSIPAAARQSEALVQAAPPAPPKSVVSESGKKRAMVRELSVTLRSKTPALVVTNLTMQVEALGGYVVGSEIRLGASGERGASVSVRVPVTQLSNVLAKLRTLGEVLREQRQSDDVTAQVIDTEARLTARRVLEKRLLDLLATARAVDDMLKIETELSRVRTEIEQLTAQSRDFAQRTETALLTVTIESPEPQLVAVGKPLSSRLREAVSSALSTSESVLLGFIELLGGLIPLLVIALGIWLPVRFVRRRRQRQRQMVAVAPVAEAGKGTVP